MANPEKVFKCVAAKFIQQGIECLKLGCGHCGSGREQPSDFFPVPTWPEFRLTIPVMIPHDHFVRSQVALYRGLFSEIETLERTKVKPGGLPLRSAGMGSLSIDWVWMSAT